MDRPWTRMSLPILALSVLAALAGAPSALALSVAPKAAELGEKECTPGVECTVTQPSTPSWLTLVNGEALLTQQSLDGVAANEYGSKPTADTTLFGSAQPYTQQPRIERTIVGSTLANLDGNDEAGDDYAIVLYSDRTLQVLVSRIIEIPQSCS